jgi:hypothetical protein
MQQQVDMQQAVHITQQLLGMMHAYFVDRKDANGNAVANNDVLLSLKHSQLLLRAYIAMRMEDQKSAGGAIVPLPARILPDDKVSSLQGGYFIPGHP